MIIILIIGCNLCPQTVDCTICFQHGTGNYPLDPGEYGLFFTCFPMFQIEWSIFSLPLAFFSLLKIYCSQCPALPETVTATQALSSSPFSALFFLTLLPLFLGFSEIVNIFSKHILSLLLSYMLNEPIMVRFCSHCSI